MEINNTFDDNKPKKRVSVKSKIVKQELEIEKLKLQEEIKKSKELVELDIRNYFIQNPDEDILANIEIYDQDGYEIIDIGNSLFIEFLNGEQLPYIHESKNRLIATDEEEGGKFSKQLVIDEKTNSKGLLVVGKGNNIDEVKYADISQFDFPPDTFFIYRENGKNCLKAFNIENVTMTV